MPNEDFSGKDAKAQSATAFPRGFLAPLRLCVRSIFLVRRPQEYFRPSRLNSALPIYVG